MKCEFWFSLWLLSKALLIWRKIQWDIIIYWLSLHVQCLLFFILTTILQFLDRFLQNHPLQHFMKICTRKARCSMYTDMTKLTLTFCNFTNAPYKPNQTLQYSNMIYICRLVRSNYFVFLFHATYKLYMWKFQGTLLQLSWKHCYFQCSLHLYQRTSLTLKQKHAFQCPVKVSLLPLQLLICNSLQCLTIPVMVSLQTYLSEENRWKSDNERCRHFGGYGNTLCPNSVMASVVCTLVSSLALSWRSNTSTFFLQNKLNTIIQTF